LEFSRTRAHYLVFKEQVLLIRIVTTSAPLSSSLFFVRGFVPLPSAPPPSGNCLCNQSRPPCQPLMADYFPPLRVILSAFVATVIYILSPLPCQAPGKGFLTPSPLMGEGWGGGEIPHIPICPVAQAFQPVQFYFECETPKGRRFHNFPSLPDPVRAGCPPSGFRPQINGRRLPPPAPMLNQ